MVVSGGISGSRPHLQLLVFRAGHYPGATRRQTASSRARSDRDSTRPRSGTHGRRSASPPHVGMKLGRPKGAQSMTVRTPTFSVEVITLPVSNIERALQF